MRVPIAPTLFVFLILAYYGNCERYYTVDLICISLMSKDLCIYVLANWIMSVVDFWFTTSFAHFLLHCLSSYKSVKVFYILNESFLNLQISIPILIHTGCLSFLSWYLLITIDNFSCSQIYQYFPLVSTLFNLLHKSLLIPRL